MTSISDLLKFLLSTFVLISTASCGYKYMSHNDIIQKRRGENIENLIAEWGAPQSTTVLPSGNTVYLFVSENRQKEKTAELKSESYVGLQQGNSLALYSTVTVKCKTSVTANKKGEVINISSNGDGCDGSWVSSQ